MALRDIIALSFNPPKTRFVLEFYQNSPPKQIQLTFDGLPFDQWCHCLAIKRIMDIESTEYIVYNNQVLQT